MKKILYVLLGVSIALSAIADNTAKQSVYISNINSQAQHYTGLDSTISFDLTANESLEQATIKIGFKFASSNLSQEENIGYMATFEPDFYLTTIEYGALQAGESKSVSYDFKVSEHIPADEYMLIVTIESLLEIDPQHSGGEILDDDSTDSIVAHAFAEGMFTVETPTLPSLKIVSATLAGSDGYALSKAELPDTIRLNLELISRALDVTKPVPTEFYLTVPGRGELKLDVVEFSESGKKTNNQWLVEPECDGCPALVANNIRGKAVSLQIDSSLFNTVSEGDVVYLDVRLDPYNEVSEWLGNKQDNILSLPIYIFN